MCLVVQCQCMYCDVEDSVCGLYSRDKVWNVPWPFADQCGPILQSSTRRSWTPNIQNKKLRSELLDVTMKVPLTTTTLRCIDKAGTCFNVLTNVFF